MDLKTKDIRLLHVVHIFVQLIEPDQKANIRREMQSIRLALRRKQNNKERERESEGRAFPRDDFFKSLETPFICIMTSSRKQSKMIRQFSAKKPL